MDTITHQPMPKPETWAEYLLIRDRMIDTTGAPLVVTDCAHCAREHFTVEPCTAEVPCPRCGSAGARCHRPSGHDAATWHVERAIAFESLCAALEAAGVPVVARWPEPPRHPIPPALFEWSAEHTDQSGDVEQHVTPPCLICNQTSIVDLTRAEARALRAGVPMQTALPSRPTAERELICHGTHPTCWVDTFGTAP